MPGYTVQRDTTIGGQATKWALTGPNGQDDFYIAKFGNKNGRVEICSELFNNQLGVALGFDMAHSGMARLGGDLYFVTQNFRRREGLVHGSLMIEDMFKARGELSKIEHVQEQSFYSINFIEEVVHAYCRWDARTVFDKLIEMLVFDALIGSMDRHAMNWGVLRSETVDDNGNESYRLAPIFDSARALLWDLPEGKLLLLDNDDQALLGYVETAAPCIGPEPTHPKVNRCNHFDFIESLLVLYRHQTTKAYGNIPLDPVQVGRKLLRQFPFSRNFSSLRKRMILKILARRAERLNRIFEEGGANVLGDDVQDATANAASVV